MKIKSDMCQVTSDKRDVASRKALARHSPLATHHPERGIALIITLILLSVTLVMAVAFLAISRRERASVVTSTDTATARLAADTALASAEAQIVAAALATTNAYDYGLLVSTNFINANGFDSSVNGYDPTNVNYDYLATGGALTPNQFLQNVANLYYLPRPPVYVPTNSLGSNEFRFYLDLNRNGEFEDSGLFPAISSDPNNPYFNLNGGTMPNIVPGNTLSNFVAGDPQWIGVLERPDAPHGPNNKFLSRYAFIAVPADNDLDLNAIHNQARNAISFTPVQDGYFRNQGVGSWELNLAALLTDLNTNQWDTVAAPYNYLQWRPTANANSGFAFQDAFSLLSYRYYFNYNSLAMLPVTLAPQSYLNYLNGVIDLYSLGNLMTGTALPPLLTPYNGSFAPWAGSDNTNHFFALTSDLFDDTKTEPNVVAPALGFTDRLLNAGTNTSSTYNRYTFYRLLSQLGTDSSPEQNKINLNYSNAAATFTYNAARSTYLTSVVLSPNAETNLTPWQPIQFFTIAADRMLRLYTTNWFQASPSNYLATYYGITGYNYYHLDSFGNVVTNDPSGVGLTNVPVFGMTNQIPAFGITNIPVLINGQFVYSSAIQRVLQLAANIYDATTNQSALYGQDYPSAFRPILYKTVLGTVTNVLIVGYQDVTSIQ